MNLRRSFNGTTAALLLFVAHPARADLADGGAPADAVVAAVDAGATASADAAPAPAELARPPELSPVTANAVATAMLATPAPVDAEPPRPITRRLWFWMAITGVIVGAVVIGIAVHNPNHTRPDCPPDYVCPL